MIAKPSTDVWFTLSSYELLRDGHAISGKSWWLMTYMTHFWLEKTRAITVVFFCLQFWRKQLPRKIMMRKHDLETSNCKMSSLVSPLLWRGRHFLLVVVVAAMVEKGKLVVWEPLPFSCSCLCNNHVKIFSFSFVFLFFLKLQSILSLLRQHFLISAPDYLFIQCEQNPKSPKIHPKPPNFWYVWEASFKEFPQKWIWLERTHATFYLKSFLPKLLEAVLGSIWNLFYAFQKSIQNLGCFLFLFLWFFDFWEEKCWEGEAEAEVNLEAHIVLWVILNANFIDEPHFFSGFDSNLARILHWKVWKVINWVVRQLMRTFL